MSLDGIWERPGWKAQRVSKPISNGNSTVKNSVPYGIKGILIAELESPIETITRIAWAEVY